MRILGKWDLPMGKSEIHGRLDEEHLEIQMSGNKVVCAAICFSVLGKLLDGLSGSQQKAFISAGIQTLRPFLHDDVDMAVSYCGKVVQPMSEEEERKVREWLADILDAKKDR